MLLRDGPECMEGHARSLERLIGEVFGGHHSLLTPSQRRLRLDLWKLINLMRQMGTLDDVEVFQLGFRCPEQLKRYDHCVKTLIDMSERKGIDRKTQESALLMHAGLWQICLVVTQFYEGLS